MFVTYQHCAVMGLSCDVVGSPVADGWARGWMMAAQSASWWQNWFTARRTQTVVRCSQCGLCVCVCVCVCVCMCVCVCVCVCSSAVDQPCLHPQSTCCQEFGGAAQVFRRSPQLVGS